MLKMSECKLLSIFFISIPYLCTDKETTFHTDCFVIKYQMFFNIFYQDYDFFSLSCQKEVQVPQTWNYWQLHIKKIIRDRSFIPISTLSHLSMISSLITLLSSISQYFLIYVEDQQQGLAEVYFQYLQMRFVCIFYQQLNKHNLLPYALVTMAYLGLDVGKVWKYHL